MNRSLVKKVYHQYLGKYSHIRTNINLTSTWYGSDYGGFYVHDNILSDNSIVYSFGIGKDISFDRALVTKFGCAVFGFDPTPKSIAWCEEQELPENFSFFGYGLAENSGTALFNLPKKEANVSGSIIGHTNVSTAHTIEVEMKSFADITKNLGHEKIDIVKMDIEGTEYDVLLSILESCCIVDQLLIEFHERFFKDGKERTIRAIDSLSNYGYHLFAVSDSCQELSFIRKGALKN